MKVELINHACFLITASPQVRILTDPWMSGNIFDNGWSPIVETKLPHPDTYDYVWVSHEHPDHFSPTMFRPGGIPSTKVILLQQRLDDQKLKNFFLSREYKVIEIPETGLEIGEVSIQGGLAKGFDSWCAIITDGVTFLNLNDCVAFDDDREIEAITRKIGKVDLLGIQFSLANWSGNPRDMLTPRIARDDTFIAMEKVFTKIAPAVVIPCASFSYFTHEENFHLNENAIKLPALLSRFPHINFCVLGCGDYWTDSMSSWDNSHGCSYWEEMIAQRARLPLLVTKTISFDKMQEQFAKMIAALNSGNDLKLLYEEMKTYDKTDAAKVYVRDHQQALSYSIFSGLEKIEANEGECDVSLSSETLFNIMKYPWGFGTLMVNGRFVANYSSFDRFASHCRLYYMNNIDKYFPQHISVEEIVDPPSLVSRLIKQINS